MLALLVAAVTNSTTNDGWMHSSGSEQPFSNEHRSIQMVREHLHIDIGSVEAKVRVEFTFKNHGEATTVEMGFPEVTYKVGDLGDLASTVDGEPVEVKRRLISHEDEDSPYKYAWVKSVHFAKGQTRTIVNTYVQGLGGDTSGNRYFGYTFATGASWFQRIEEVRVTYSFDPAAGLTVPVPYKNIGEKEEAVEATVTGKHSRKIIWNSVEPNFSLYLDMKVVR